MMVLLYRLQVLQGGDGAADGGFVGGEVGGGDGGIGSMTGGVGQGVKPSHHAGIPGPPGSY
jgi:hypothetical protein